MVSPNRPAQSNFAPPQGPFPLRVWGQGMGQNGMPYQPFGQQPFMPPQMGMAPMNQMPFQGQMSQNFQNGPINHPFLDQNGNFDINKLMGHADNINKFINTAKPMMKQLSPLFNMFRGQ
ncbi:YppG family protein [Pullulanibacillus sp. KACC 23026]|uniref:YppG family protein n=1 Tax=Pullulanibacillus sp. KACC 23026 TaxID=3028315 RepID=UPI0023B1FB3D|nr:YppG family protein [Pullulanibacillus sp. KACC 23026]WEG11933.1 YppG family protein [Pullulanibacillus sp. KACC 23026]